MVTKLFQKAQKTISQGLFINLLAQSFIHVSFPSEFQATISHMAEVILLAVL